MQAYAKLEFKKRIIKTHEDINWCTLARMITVDHGMTTAAPFAAKTR